MFECAHLLTVPTALQAGCSVEPSVYARMPLSGLEVLVCDLANDPSGLEVLAGSTFSELKTVWVASGPGLVLPPTISYGVPPADWTTTVGPAPISGEDTRAQVYFKWAENNQVATFDLTASEESRWISEGGDPLAGGCETR